jgi:hypothetical protein
MKSKSQMEVNNLCWSEDNIKVGLKVIGCKNVDWINFKCFCEGSDKTLGTIKYGSQ